MPSKLTYEDFLESLRLAPRVVVELLIENDRGDLLLLKRNEQPFKDYLHLPGGFLLKDEPIDDCAKRISWDELGLELDTSKGEFRGLFESIGRDPRDISCIM